MLLPACSLTRWLTTMVVLVSNCTAGPTASENEAALFNIRTFFGQVATSQQLGEMWMVA